jgi:hypothetical protein
VNKLHRIGTGLSVVALTAAFGWQMLRSGPRVLARSTAPDGTECLVIRTMVPPASSGAAFAVEFYSRKPGGPWLWQYLDPAAARWPECRLVHNPGNRTVTIFSGGESKQTLDLDWPHQHQKSPPSLARGS